ncbi:hypothetical protein ID0562_04210 [Helicobacter pylori]
MYKSQFKQLGKFIAGTLLENSRKKIIESNCNKALKVIEKLQKAIATTIDREMDPTIKEIRDKLPETYDNLDRSRDKFVSNLNNSAFKEIERFRRSDFRIEMYEHIDRGIENEECKKIFKVELQLYMKELKENIKKQFEKHERQFCEDSQKDIERFEERIKNSLAIIIRERINANSGFDFNIDSGINALGLTASIGGLIALLVTPLGGIALALGLVLGAIGIVKSV